MSLEITQPTETPVVSPAAPASTAPTTPTTPAVNPQDLKPGTAEYNAHMAAIGRQARGELPSGTHEEPAKAPTVETPAERPQWLPEKFKSVEDMAQAYSELEKKLGGAAPTTPQTPATGEEVGDEAEAIKTYEKYFAEIRDDGSLSTESYEALTKKFPKYLVDAHIELAQQVNELSSYRVAQEEAEVIQSLGGQEVFKQVTTWASQNLSATELDAFNKQVVTSKDTAMLLLQGLKARMEATVGRIPTLVTGGTGAVSSDVYGNKSDFQMAMADPRYSSDQTYRQAVYEKLRRTKAVNPGFSVV